VGIFQEVFPTKILYGFLVSLILASWPAHRTLLHFTILTKEDDLYESQSFCWTMILKSVSSTKGPCLCLRKVCRRSQHRIDWIPGTSTFVVLTGAQGLLNHSVQLVKKSKKKVKWSRYTP
jgi:hypothetical protein